MKSAVPSRRVALLKRSSRYLIQAWFRQFKGVSEAIWDDTHYWHYLIINTLNCRAPNMEIMSYSLQKQLHNKVLGLLPIKDIRAEQECLILNVFFF